LKQDRMLVILKSPAWFKEMSSKGGRLQEGGVTFCTGHSPNMRAG
jgi:hypothetical protein